MITPQEFLEAKYGPHPTTIGGRRVGSCWPALQVALSAPTDLRTQTQPPKEPTP